MNWRENLILISSVELNGIFPQLTFSWDISCSTEVKPWKPVIWSIHTLWIMFTVQLTGPLKCISPWHLEKGYVRFHLGEGQKRSFKDGQSETFRGYDLQHLTYLLFTQWATFASNKKEQNKHMEEESKWAADCCGEGPSKHQLAEAGVHSFHKDLELFP